MGLTEKHKQQLAWVMGVGLVLFPVHFLYQPAQSVIFLPAIGFMLIALVVAVLWARRQFTRDTLGPRWVWIPMLVIVTSMLLRLVVYHDIAELASLLMGVSLFGVYLSARTLGKAILKPMPYAVLVLAFSVMVFALTIDRGQDTGGLITNYQASAGYMILGFIVSPREWKDRLLLPVGVAIFLTGSLEAYVAIFVLGIVVLVRKDWSRRLWLSLAAVACLMAVWFLVGWGETLYKQPLGNIKGVYELITGEYTDLKQTEFLATTGRWEIIEKAMGDIRLLGHGYNLTHLHNNTVHNVPLVIVDQLGVVAGLAWLVASVYLLVKTQWEYTWLTVMVLGIFDHYTWTQFAPWWWALAGVTSVAVVDNRYIFKEVSG